MAAGTESTSTQGICPWLAGEAEEKEKKAGALLER